MITFIGYLLAFLISSYICHGTGKNSSYISSARLPFDTSSRIIGGTATSMDRYPYIVGMLADYWGDNRFKNICGGSVITSRHILSAAHCYLVHPITGVDHSQPRYWKARCGSTFRSLGGVIANVSIIIKHPKFDYETVKHDISIIVLASKLSLEYGIKQALLPSRNFQQPDNAIAYVVGWGTTAWGGLSSEILLQGLLLTVNQNICMEIYKEIGSEVGDAMLCAGLLGIGGADACQGDSGGPLVFNDIVIGITSFGNECASPYYPGVYTKVSHYTDWILFIVNIT